MTDSRTNFIVESKELVNTIIRRSGIDQDDVEDCYQSILLSSLENKTEHDPSQSSIKTYAINFVKYRIIDFKRSLKRIQEIPVDPADFRVYPSNELDIDETEIELITNSAINKIGIIAKHICEMIVEGYMTKQIAEELKVSKERVRYIKTVLRKLVENEIEENCLKKPKKRVRKKL